MQWIIPINSFLVSGFTMLFFNFVAIKLFKLLTTSVCASVNLRTVYDERKPLRPHRSRYAFFGGPTDPPALANAFALLITAFAFLVVLLDFSINGSTATYRRDLRYASLVRVLPDAPRPFRFDYAAEYARHRPAGAGTALKTYVSRRLVALSEFHSCLVLNITHHAMLAYAFRDLRLDTRPVPLDTFLHGGECLSARRFDPPQRLFTFHQTPWPRYNCPLNGSARFDLGPPLAPGSPVRAATLRPDPARKCDLDLRAAACFAKDPAEAARAARKSKIPADGLHCAVVADYPRAKEKGLFVLYMSNGANPRDPEHAWVRRVTLPQPGDAARLAANVAFFRGLDFPHGMLNAALMALADIQYNVTLTRRDERNVSEVNAWLAGPVLAVLAAASVALALAALVLWDRVVRRKNRRRYINFTSVDEVLAMVRVDGLSKSKDGDGRDQAIFVAGGRPVVMPEQCFERMRMSSKVAGGGSPTTSVNDV